MIAIAWDDSYTVHVDSIDAQHKKIMRLINDLNRISDFEDNGPQLQTALTNLCDYTREHFEYEESFLEIYHYPFFKSHREKHDGFLKTIEQAKRDLSNGRVKNKRKMVDHLAFWLKNHIIKEDKQYSCFMLEHGIK